ncbi:SusC/RagA family TonB-linked outer membrane protein [Sphingobacterium sp. SGG-5]|nr:SusC/RagA family TonB-linked outer membrane protein [Sphingobacterium sp. SGG-5]
MLRGKDIDWSLEGKFIVVTPKRATHEVTDIARREIQQYVVHGRVVGEKGNPLQSVTVSVKGTDKVVLTDKDGVFTFSVDNPNAILVYTMVGFARQEKPLNGVLNQEVTLRIAMAEMEEVVVSIGYGTQSRDKITTAISTLDQKVLENVPYTNAASALQGGIPGLMVQSTNGQPGSAPRIILRGGTSINNPNGSVPLYIIDGVIRPDMNDVPADDIASMQVLKDAAATAIYGARASNGVVLVTTKTGNEGATRISFSHDYSVADEAIDMQHVSAADYIVGARQSLMWAGVKNTSLLDRLGQATGYGTGNDLTNNTAYTTQYLSAANAHKLDEGWQSVQDPYDPSKTIIFKETDFQKLRRQVANSQNYHVSALGGSSKATYSASLGYLDGEGTALASDYKRLSYNINGSLQVTPNLKISGRTLYTHVNSHAQTNYYNTFTRSAALPSTTKFTFEDGTIAPGLNSSLGNPLYYQVGPYAPRRKTITTKSTKALSAQWEIVRGLTLEPQASLYETTEHFNYFQPKFLSGITTIDATRAATQNSISNRYWQVGSVLTYSKNIGFHNLETKVGYEYYDKNYWAVFAGGRGAATDHIPTLNAAAEPRSVDGSESRFVTEGLFSRLNYDYNGKYLFSFNFRYDGASNLGAKTRTGFFPGVSLGWNLHREGFWQQLVSADLMQLKLRASYGENGNIQGLGDFQAQGIYAVNAIYNGESAIQPSEIPNENLAWEKSRTFDMGFDLGLFQKRINLVFDYYDRLTSDLLTNVTLPTSSGYSSILTNNGSLRNRGVEFGLDMSWLKRKSLFQWNTTFNFSRVKTRIERLPFNGVERNRQGGIYIFDPSLNGYVWAGGLQEGGRIGDMFALHFMGVYATDQEATMAPVNTFMRINDKRSYGGDSKWGDLDKNGFIDERDKYLVGNQYPTITGGFSNTLSYKNLSMNVRTDFTLGHTIFSYTNHFLNGQMQGDAMPLKEYYARSWKKQGDITDMPRYMYQDQQANLSEGSDMFYEKGDFLALRELSLVYTLPSRLTQKIKMTNLRLNVTGYNLHYFTNYSGLNPEDGGRDDGRYPNPRTFTMGIQASF